MIFFFLGRTSWALDAVSENLLRLRHLASAYDQEKAAADLDWKSLPRSVDMRQEMEDLQVNFLQQGERNSCAAFSATSVLEFQQKRLGNDIDISEQYTLWAAKKAGATPDIGLTIQQLAMGFQLYKVCREEVMPYKSSDVILEPTDIALEDARKMPPIAMDFIVKSNSHPGQSVEDIFQICRTLARRQIVCLASEWGDGDGTLNAQNELQEVPMKGGHMVILTGYELSPGDPLGGYFLLRNSWGMSWGDFGYAKMPFSFARKHAMEAVTFRFENAPGKPVAEMVSTGMADAFTGFLVVKILIGLVSAWLAVFLALRILARPIRGVRPLLVYLLGAFFFYILLALQSGAMVRRIELGDATWSAVLAAACLLVIFRWIQATGKRFEISRWRAAGFLVMIFVLWNAFAWAGNRFVPGQSFHTWQAAVENASVIDLQGLLKMTTDQREAYLQMNLPQPESKGETDPDASEKAWFAEWSGELREERSRLHANQPLVLRYYEKRVAAYEQMRRLSAAKSVSDPRAMEISTSGKAVLLAAEQTVERDQQLWKMYEELQKEKAGLDPKNAAAVTQFNQKAAAYQALKSAKSHAE